MAALTADVPPVPGDLPGEPVGPAGAAVGPGAVAAGRLPWVVAGVAAVSFVVIGGLLAGLRYRRRRAR